MLNSPKLKIKVYHNFNNLKWSLLLLPSLLLLVISLFFVNKSAFSINGYIRLQETLFFYLNSTLSSFPNLQFNLTQLGNALLLFPLLSVFIIYVPKIWGAILTSGIISLVVSFLLKKIFAVPRPAAIFNTDNFVVIGKTLSGHTSLPSGHSITAFTVITILLFALMPKKNSLKIIWSIFILALGLFIAFSRVGVGAHFPLDVIVGSIIGYMAAVLGIIISNKVNWWDWINNKKYYPIFILLFTICGVVIIKKILANNLFIFYLSLLSIISTLYLMVKIYVKK